MLLLLLLLLLLLAGITCNGSRPRSHVRRVKRAGAAQRGRTVLMVTAGIAHAVLQSKACGARLQLLLAAQVQAGRMNLKRFGCWSRA